MVSTTILPATDLIVTPFVAHLGTPSETHQTA
jgi:hypothetical protein